ncbi:MAG: histidine phosphatase family protein [bacterium]
MRKSEFMRSLILVKHSMPELQADRPAAQWRLSEDGRHRCLALARHLAAHAPVAIVASREPKAAETAMILAKHLNRPCVLADDLHEHERTNVPLMKPAEFQASVAAMLAEPDELVLGLETARQAQQRFARAVNRVLDAHPEGNIVIVAHGTVISLLLALRSGQDALAVWKRLGLPSFVELVLPGFELKRVEASIEA